MILAIVAILLGFLIGLQVPILYNGHYAIYVSVGIMAGIDSIVGAINANLYGKYKNEVFVSGLLVNSILAFFLAYIGDALGLPLYYSALFVFGTRLFNNMAKIRRYFIDKYMMDKSTRLRKKKADRLHHAKTQELQDPSQDEAQ